MSTNKKTLVLGASTNPTRYANIAINRLRSHGHEVVALGLKPGKVADVDIDTKPQFYPNVDTVTMYLGAPRQIPFYQYLIALNPKRIIFNPGAENPELAELANRNGIETEEACTLVLLNLDQY
ncbi:MAG: CoA-binding protein [Bacteroidetes bacterium]|nr:CoA-binding protein [Bacteroidota bacterium]